MGNDDWYRNKDWDDQIEAAFRARLNRSRGDYYFKRDRFDQAYEYFKQAIVLDSSHTHDQSHAILPVCQERKTSRQRIRNRTRVVFSLNNYIPGEMKRAVSGGI